MKRTTPLVAALMLCVAVAGVVAHEATYKGTFVSAEAARIHITVIDEKTNKDTAMAFAVTGKTKVLRGDKTVPFADARIKKDERIAVTVNHDVPGNIALVIRLAPAAGK